MNAITSRDNFIKAIKAESPDDQKIIADKLEIVQKNVLSIFKERKIDSKKVLAIY